MSRSDGWYRAGAGGATNITDMLMDTDGDAAADQIIVADGNKTGFVQFVL